MMLDSTGNNIKLVKKYLKLKIFEDNITFRGHKQEREHLYDIVKKTISDGESHSALIIGSRGVGKTTLINSTLTQLSEEVDLASDAIIIKLNGLLHHEEKVALKAITAQMQLENAVGDRVFGTFAENLEYLLNCLKSGADRRCKSMVFVLDEFDMFCHSGRTQTLLYNLFDITHSGDAPVCVVGVTCRLDIMELLEKRVKSRFSHRHIKLFPNEDNDNRTHLENFLDVFQHLLSMPLDVTAEQNRTNKKRIKDVDRTPSRKSKKGGVQKRETQTTESKDDYSIPRQVFERLNIEVRQFEKLDVGFVEDWNAHVKALARSQEIVDCVEKFTYYTVNEQLFRDVLFQVVSRLSPSHPYIETSDICGAIDATVSPEHKVAQIQSLSILELSLLIAMKHNAIIFDNQPVNFEMVFHRYTKFANANSSAQTVPRPVILKAFEHLQALEVIMPVKSSDSIHNAADSSYRTQKEYQIYTLAVSLDTLNEAIKGYSKLPTEIIYWYNNDIV